MNVNYQRHFLKEREVKSILEGVSRELHLDLKQIFEGEVKMELVEADFAEIFLIRNRPLLFKRGNKIFPSLIFGEISELIPKVVVDMGAVPHVCNGADIMAPGIVRFEGEFSEGDLVFVVDEEYNKNIAVGQTALRLEAAKKASRGIVIHNIHFVGDKIWNFIKKWT
ncbi:MAG: DUF1947 domain-containing protein [Thermoproteota archaeon]